MGDTAQRHDQQVFFTPSASVTPTRGRPASATARLATGALMRVVLLSSLLLSACSISAQEIAMTTEAQGQATSGPMMFGAFTYGGVWQGMQPVLDLESALGRRLDVVHWFMNWDHVYDPRLVASVADGGRAPLISWQPHRQSVQDIAAGRYDEYIRSWARGIRDAPELVYLRPFPEMNGDWVPWNGDPDTLRAAWRRMAHLFDDEGAHNVRWVFSPNVTDEPRTQANRMENYYPGHDVVDILALDGYNWGATRPHIGWRSFETVFTSGYDRITQLGTQPVWLTEVATTEHGGDKAQWIRDMLDSRAFPRVLVIVWFNEDKETDWRLESSPASLASFRDWFEDWNGERR